MVAAPLPEQKQIASRGYNFHFIACCSVFLLLFILGILSSLQYPGKAGQHF
jgi:hypothetical protein